MKTKLKAFCQSALRTLALVAGIAFAAPDAAAAALPYTSTQTYTQDGTYQMYIKYRSSTTQNYTITINLYKGNSATGTPVATWTETQRTNTSYYEATHSTTLKMTASTAYTWQVTVTASSDASKVTITSGPTFSEIGSTYLWNGGSSGVWSTKDNWKFQEGTRNKIPTKLDQAYIDNAATIDLNNSAVEVPYQVAFRANDITFKNGSFKENNGAASAPGSGRFFMKRGGTFDSINFTTGTQANKYSYVSLMDQDASTETTLHTTTFKNVTATEYLSLFFYNFAKLGNATFKFIDTDTTFGNLYGYTWKGTNFINHIVLQNSCVSFGSFTYGANKEGGLGAGTTETTDMADFRVILGEKNVMSGSPALQFRATYRVVEGSRLSVDASGVGDGIYSILEAYALTNPQYLTVTKVRAAGGVELAVGRTINQIYENGPITVSHKTKVYLLSSDDNKSLTLKVTSLHVEPMNTPSHGYIIRGLPSATAGKVETAYVFTNTTTSGVTWQKPDGVTSVRYLVVGGGGAGGKVSDSSTGTGGGGGGGFVTDTVSVSSSAISYTVKVGAGGSNQGNGYESSIKTGTTTIAAATGGGAGAGGTTAAKTGGSGGGGFGNGAGGNGTGTQGNKGGTGSLNAGAGGGGAGSEGQNGGTKDFGGNGGGGRLSDITGIAVYYAGGGGGGGGKSNSAPKITVRLGGVGGIGGGGAGGMGRNGHTDITGAGEDGVNGLGGGGGGYGRYPKNYGGTRGGDGVVIIRFAEYPVACDYVQTDGVGWFDLGFKPHLRNTRVEVVATVDSDLGQRANAMAWAAHNSSAQRVVGYGYWPKGDDFSYYITADGTVESSWSPDLVVPKGNLGIHTACFAGQNFSIDGWGVMVDGTVADGESGENMTLFREVSELYQDSPKLKLYSVRVWTLSNGGATATLVHNFVPVTGGTLYDTIDRRALDVKDGCFTSGNDVGAATMPAPATTFAYDATQKSLAVSDTAQYTVLGQKSATIPGTYRVTIVPNAGYYWSDHADDDLRYAPRDIFWTITGTWNPQPTDWGYSNLVTIAGRYYTILTYTNTATAGFPWKMPATATSFDYLVLGGGGGGGGGFSADSRCGGGGGAGGALTGSASGISANTAFTVKVGAGGSGGAGGHDGGTATAAGTNGSNSEIRNSDSNYVTAHGGGGGGKAINATAGTDAAGQGGGCGGGGGTARNGGNTYYVGKGGTGSGGAKAGWFSGATVYKNNGGDSGKYKTNSGGGGGVGGVGGTGADGSQGIGTSGPGLPFAITGDATKLYGMGGCALYSDNPAFDGENTTGNGGNGGYRHPGGNGGSGIVVIRYEVPQVTFTATPYSASYDGHAHGIGLTVGSLVSGVTATIRYSATGEEGTYTLTTAPQITDVADSPKTVYFQISAPGYISATGLSTITITKAANSISAVNMANWTYGGTPSTPSCTAPFGANTATYSYAETGAGPYSSTVPSNAGTYWVKATIAGTDNYNGATKTTSFTIDPAALSATAENKSVEYGSNPPAYTVAYSGWVKGEETPTTAASLTSTYTKTSNVGGDYPITFSTVPVFANYAVTTHDGKVTVTQAGNSWTTGPTISPTTWVKDVGPTTATAAAKFGTVVVTCDGSTVKGDLKAYLKGLALGEHTVKFAVTGTANYSELAEVSITVSVTLDKYYGKLANSNRINWNESGNWYADIGRNTAKGAYPNSSLTDVYLGQSDWTGMATNYCVNKDYDLGFLTMEGGKMTCQYGNFHFPSEGTDVARIVNNKGSLRLDGIDLFGNGFIRCVHGTTTEFCVVPVRENSDIGIKMDTLTSGQSATVGIYPCNGGTTSTLGYLTAGVSGSTANVVVNNARLVLTSTTVVSGGAGKLALNFTVGALNVAQPAEDLLSVAGALSIAADSTLTVDATAIAKAGTYPLITAGTLTDNAGLVDGATVTAASGMVGSVRREGNGLYLVLRTNCPVAQVGATTYTTLEDAFAAAQDGDTVALLTNVVTKSISVTKNVTLAGDVWEVALPKFTVDSGKTLTITNGYFGVDAIDGTYRIVGGKYVTNTTFTVASGYHYAKLASIVQLYNTYSYQVIAGAEKDVPSDEVVLPALKGDDDDYVGEIRYTLAELEKKGITGTTAAIVTNLNTIGANKNRHWENLVLGLSHTDTNAVPVLKALQTSKPDKLTLKLDGLNIDEKAGATVRCRVMYTDEKRVTWLTDGKYYTPAQIAEQALPDTGVRYYRVEIEVIPAK